MTSTRFARGALIAATVVLVGTGCSSGDSTDAADGTAAGSTAATTSAEATATGPVGAGCAQLDPAVLSAAATQPVATAAAGNPLLTTLSSVVGSANLTAALDAQTDITVIAPANSAFDGVPPDQLNALVGDLPRLTSVLQHHVISGRLAPDQLVGDHTTLLGDTLTIAGTADAPTVSADQTLLGAADATLVCGNVQTANATVYIVDQVLSPEA